MGPLGPQPPGVRVEEGSAPSPCPPGLQPPRQMAGPVTQSPSWEVVCLYPSDAGYAAMAPLATAPLPSVSLIGPSGENLSAAPSSPPPAPLPTHGCATASVALPRAMALTVAPAPRVASRPPPLHQPSVGSLPHVPVFLENPGPPPTLTPRPRGLHPSPRSVRNRFSRVKQSRVIYQQLSGPSEGREWPGPEMAPTSSVDKVSELSSDEC